MKMALFLLTQLVGKPHLDRQHEKIAVLKDIVVRINPDAGWSEETYPPIVGVIAHTADRDV